MDPNYRFKLHMSDDFAVVLVEALRTGVVFWTDSPPVTTYEFPSNSDSLIFPILGNGSPVLLLPRVRNLLLPGPWFSILFQMVGEHSIPFWFIKLPADKPVPFFF